MGHHKHHKHCHKSVCEYKIEHPHRFVQKIIGLGDRGNNIIAFCESGKKTYPIGKRKCK